MEPDSLNMLGYVDYQILQWHDKLPNNLKLDPIRLCHDNLGLGTSYFQAVMFIRKNYLRNLIYRPILQSPT